MEERSGVDGGRYENRVFDYLRYTFPLSFDSELLNVSDGLLLEGKLPINIVFTALSMKQAQLDVVGLLDFANEGFSVVFVEQVSESIVSCDHAADGSIDVHCKLRTRLL